MELNAFFYLRSADKSQLENLDDLALREQREFGVEAIGSSSFLQSGDHILGEHILPTFRVLDRMSTRDQFQEHHPEAVHITFSCDFGLRKVRSSQLRSCISSHCVELPGGSVRVQDGEKFTQAKVTDLWFKAFIQKYVD